MSPHKGLVTLYADGSCWPNPGPEGGWGCVILIPNLAIWMFGRIFADDHKKVTNNRAELCAILYGLRAIPTGYKVVLWSDSKWSINVVTGVWNTSKNLDLIWPIKREIKRLNEAVMFEHVKGHNGNLYNETADQLAGKPWDTLIAQEDLTSWNDRDLRIMYYGEELPEIEPECDFTWVPHGSIPRRVNLSEGFAGARGDESIVYRQSNRHDGGPEESVQDPDQRS